jgi:hypothetical protein
MSLLFGDHRPFAVEEHSTSIEGHDRVALLSARFRTRRRSTLTIVGSTTRTGSSPTDTATAWWK